MPRGAGRLAVLLLAFAALTAPATAHGALGDRSMRMGDRGADVRGLQKLLVKAGYRASVDGSYGPGTQRIVRRFQKTSRLRVTGVAGRGTLARLRTVTGTTAPLTATPAPAGGHAGGSTPAAPATATGAVTPAGPTATVGPDGMATAPAGAPPQVVAMIDAGNHIATTPYRYGGGHKSFDDSAYDCSGSVSYALHSAGLLASPLDSTSLTKWGDPGAGPWVTVYANGGHAYMVVAGLRFDTSGRTKANTRWQAATRSADGFVARHPAGL